MAKKITETHKSNRVIKIFLLIIAILFIGYFGVSLYIANNLIKSAPNPSDDSPTFVAPQVANVTFLATDGINLHGWFFQNTRPNTNNRIIIFVSGIGQNKADSDYYALFIAHNLYQEGYSILLYDPREIEPQVLINDLGQTRGNDVLGAVQFAEQKGYEPKNIGIIADSLGTAAVLMVVEKLNTVGPIVIDSGIARMQPVVEHLMASEHGIPSFLYPGVLFLGKVIYHIDIGNINPVNHVKKVPNRAFLFLIGTNDNVVPIENSTELLKAANPASKLVTFSGATHVNTYRSNPTLYLNSVNTFFNQQFPNQ